jgi:Zn-dependent peptidase ImmA (M78 family)
VEGSEMLSTEEEEEANEFAANTLVPAEFFDEMLNLDQNFRTIMRFARRIGVSPGIIVGQLQHHGKVRRNKLNFLKTRYAWE